VLVTSAVLGRDEDGPITKVSDEAWHETLAVGVTSLLWLYRHAIPQMVAAGHGSIVQIGSKVAERGTPDRAAYTAAKGAVHALGRQVAIDYAGQGIRVNTIAPGYILGKARDGLPAPETLAWIEGMHLTRPVTTEDVAHAAAYLAGSGSGAITGQTIMVDGGGSIGRAVVLG
jgi:3-oxoacyl-[acyl-carrier protein] reductase